MTAREALARIVYEDATMQELGFVQSRVYAAGSVDTPDTEEVFIIIRVEPQEKAFGNVGATAVSYWVHLPKNKSRDYRVIDAAIDRLKELLAEITHYAGSDGWVLSAATWLDTSRDLTDDAFNTLTRNVTFRVAAHFMVTP